MFDRLLTNPVEGARRDVFKYYVYQGSMSAGFVAPIIIEYLLSRGITYSEVGFLTALFMATWTAGEVPAGYLGDRFGRSSMLAVSSFLTIVAMVLFGLSGTVVAFGFAYVLWGISVVFRTGVDTAWLYDKLAESGEEEKFASVQGRGRAIHITVGALTALTGAQLATIDWTYPFFANAGVYSVSIVAALTFSTPAVTEYDSGTFTVADVISVLREFLSRPTLRSFVVYTGFFFGLYGVATTFTQPIATNVGFDIVDLGWLYAGFALMAAPITFFSGDIERIVGVRRWFLSVPLLVGLLFVASTVYPLLVILALFVVRAAKTVSEPLREQYLNRHTESLGRATVLSTMMMVSTFFMIIFRIVGGELATYTGPIEMLAMLSAVMIACLLLVLAVRSPVPRDGPVAGDVVSDD